MKTISFIELCELIKDGDIPLEITFDDDYTSICEKIFEGDVDELLQILNEGDK